MVADPEMRQADRIRTLLESAKRDLARSISAYPTPITGCDVQFNYLLEQRREVVRQLNELERILGAAGAGDRAERLRVFVSSSVFIDPKAAAELLADIQLPDGP